MPYLATAVLELNFEGTPSVDASVDARKNTLVSIVPFRPSINTSIKI